MPAAGGGAISSPNLYIPFFNTYVVINWVVYMILAAFVIVGTVNSVNITDGLDGLSSSVTVPVAVFFTVLGVVWKGFPQLGIFGGAMVGGLLAFLLYNHYPAKVFMGDTGSLFLGGAVAALAFAYDMPLVLIPVGIVYICETHVRHSAGGLLQAHPRQAYFQNGAPAPSF